MCRQQIFGEPRIIPASSGFSVSFVDVEANESLNNKTSHLKVSVKFQLMLRSRVVDSQLQVKPLLVDSTNPKKPINVEENNYFLFNLCQDSILFWTMLVRFSLPSVDFNI